MIRPMLVALLVLGLLPSCVLAQEWAEKMFSSLHYDFGPVARGAVAEHRFTIKNLYKEDVRISSVRSSCGCTNPVLTKDTLKTYEEAELIAKFDTVKFKGQHQATLTVTIDQPYFAEVRLLVKGYVRRDVVFSPGKVDFGTVPMGLETERDVQLAYAGRDDWKIMDVQSTDDHLVVAMQETQRGGGRVGYQLKVRLLPSAPAGYVNSELVIITNDSNMPRVPLAVEGRVAAQLTVSPSALHLGVVKPGETVTRNLVVKGETPFRVLKVTCPDACFTFQVDQESKKLHLIPVIFTAGDEPGKILQQIEIETDLDNVKAPAVTAQAEVSAP